MLGRFEVALEERRIGLAPTIATVQDALGTDNATAQSFREVLLARGARSLPEVLESLRIALVSAARARLDASRIEVAWTHPGPIQLPVRTTGAVAREIAEAARTSLLVVGYSVTIDTERSGLAAQTVAAMAAAAARGVAVTAILHRDIANRVALMRGWPISHEPPSILTWPEREGDEKASLHAKVLVADSRDALVTSANLTYHGFEANVEVGVRIGGQPAGQLEAMFHELIRVGDLVPWEA